jgi:hypothetical protein
MVDLRSDGVVEDCSGWPDWVKGRSGHNEWFYEMVGTEAEKRRQCRAVVKVRAAAVQ